MATVAKLLSSGRSRLVAPSRTTSWWIALAAGIALAIAFLASRLPGLGQSFWEDELWTVVNYVDPGLGSIYDPSIYKINNHVAYSVLTWAAGSLVGGSEVLYRLGSTLPAIAAVAVLGTWLWRRLTPWTAVVIAAVFLVSPMHFVQSRLARGYGLAFLAAALWIVASTRLSDGGPKRWVAVLAASGAVGIWALPVMAVPFLLHTGVLLLNHRARLGAVVATAAAGVASIGLYWPLLGELVDVSGSVTERRGGAVVPPHGVVTGPLERFVTPVLQFVHPSLAGALGVVVGGAVVVYGAVWLARNDRWLLALLAVPIVGFFAVLAVREIPVYARYTSPVLVPTLTLFGIGLARVGVALARPRWTRALGAAALAALLVSVSTSFVDHVLAHVREPREAFKETAAAIEARDADTEVITDDPFPYELRYYLDRKVLDLKSEQLNERICTDDPQLIFVTAPAQSDRRDTPIRYSCLEDWNTEPVLIPQRARGPTRIWFPPAQGRER